MAANILESYLISLGFQSDDPSFRKFQGVMDQAERTVASHTTGMAKSIIEAQAAITSGFFSVAGAIIGLVDKVAMADQGYRLLGLRMFMTTDQARKMEIVTKTLGASLAEIFWDPELRQRAGVLLADYNKLSKALGPNFEQVMRQFRDIRADVMRLNVAGQILGMTFTKDLFGKLALGDVAAKLNNFVNNLKPETISKWADTLSTAAVPVLKETWTILKGIGSVLAEAGVAFTNFIGLLSGDHSIQGTTFDFMNLLKAVEHIEKGFESFLKWVTEAEGVLAHFASAVSLMLSGKFGDAKAELMAGLKEFTAGAGATVGAAVGGAIGGPPGAAVGAAAGAGIGALTQKFTGTETPNQGAKQDANLGTLFGSKNLGSASTTLSPAEVLQSPGFLSRLSYWLRPPDYTGREASKEYLNAPWWQKPFFPEDKKYWKPAIPEGSISPAKAPVAHESSLVEMIRAASDKYGIAASLALAIAKQESGINQVNTGGIGYGPVGAPVQSRTGALGVMQLELGTAKTLGVDAAKALENIDGGVKYLAQLLKRYGGDEAKAIAAYNAGPGRVDKAKSLQDLPAETQKYVPNVLGLEKGFAAKPELDKQQTTIAPAPLPNAAAVSKFDQVTPQPSGSAAIQTPSTVIASAATQPAPVVRDFMSSQSQDALSSYLQRAAAPVSTDNSVSNSQQNVKIDVGGIYIQQPGADGYTIERSVTDGIRKSLSSQTQWDMIQLQPQY